MVMGEIKILVVEDELIAAESLALDLQRQGYKVVGILDSGSKTLEQIPHKQPDLIIMDILLKGDLDGITTAEIISSQYQIPVVYLTAYADASTLKRATQTSPYGYLVKPYKPQDLFTTVQIALAKHQENKKIQDLLAKEKELNELKSRALALASHDLRTPLATILSSSELLRYYGDTWSQTKRDKHFQRIETTVSQMTDLLEDLLINKKLEEGKLKFNPIPVDIVKLGKDLIENFRLSLSSNHQLIFNSNCQFYQTKVDANLFRRTLMNLISNACKYSPQGGKIQLTLQCKLNKVVCLVQDEGIGMSREDQSKIFQIFSRATNVGNIEGTGLGLYIVKQVVELHQGTISVDSQTGLGTCFKITIPSGTGNRD